VQRAKTSRTRKVREHWRRKAIAAAAEYSKRGLTRTKRCEAVMDAFEAEAKALLTDVCASN
jgi:hypothetical protein